jgi:hypothetical protein
MRAGTVPQRGRLRYACCTKGGERRSRAIQSGHPEARLAQLAAGVLASAEMTCTAVRATKARRAKARAEARHGSRPALGVLEAGFQRPNKTVMRNWTEGAIRY